MLAAVGGLEVGVVRVVMLDVVAVGTVAPAAVLGCTVVSNSSPLPPPLSPDPLPTSASSSSPPTVDAPNCTTDAVDK